MRFPIAVLLVVLVVPTAWAMQRPWAVGGGLYGSALNYSRFDRDEVFGGVALAASYAFNDHAALRGAYFHTVNDDFADWRARGLDVALLGGVNLRSDGFKGYLGLGYFTESWRGEGWDERLAGPQAVIGGGFNWPRVSFDLWVAARSAAEYADLLENEGFSGGRARVHAGGVTVSFRL